MGTILFGCAIGFVAWFLVRYLAAGFYTVNQNERAVKTSFGRAERVGNATTLAGPHRRHARPPRKRSATIIRKCASSRRAGPTSNGRGKGLQSLRRHADHQHGVRPGKSRRQLPRHHPRSRHQGPAQHRPERPDPLPRLRAQPLRLPLRREASHRPRHGLFRLRPARAHRQLRGARQRGHDRRPRRLAQSRRHRRHRHLHQRPPQKPAPTSTTTWTRNAPSPPRATASRSTPRSSPASIRRRRSSPPWRPSTPPTTRSPPTSASRRPRADQKIVQSKRAVEIETLKAQAEVEPLIALADQLTRSEDRAAPAR